MLVGKQVYFENNNREKTFYQEDSSNQMFEVFFHFLFILLACSETALTSLFVALFAYFDFIIALINIALRNLLNIRVEIFLA